MNNFSAPITQRKILASRDVKVLLAPSTELFNREIVIAIAHKEQTQQLLNAIESAKQQCVVINKKATILILDDQSSEQVQHSLIPQLTDDDIIYFSANCGSPARARNALLDFVDDNFPCAKWVARLDADDTFVANNAVDSLCREAELNNKKYAIGSNLLLLNNKIINQNIADTTTLLSQSNLIAFIEAFCLGKQSQELPSCNLVLSAHYGARYPNTRSAEDHWLIAQLLCFNSSDACIVPYPIYCTYSLDGNDSNQNKSNNVWAEQRLRLAEACNKWAQVINSPNKALLGAGLEGIVYVENEHVIKQYYSWSLNKFDVEQIQDLIRSTPSSLPKVNFYQVNEQWYCSYKHEENLTKLPKRLSKQTVLTFLTSLYTSGIATNNIKRDNLRLTATGQLRYIDIGKDITPLSASRFLDMSARLYAIAILGLNDEYWARRLSATTQETELKKLSGFNSFYKDLVSSLSIAQFEEQLLSKASTKVRNKIDNEVGNTVDNEADNKAKRGKQYNDVTLLIKACAQDAYIIKEQVSHIVNQLNKPSTFKKTVLLIDSFKGPFLRQYQQPNFNLLVQNANELKALSLIDEILISPADKHNIKSVHQHWFGESATSTHTTQNAPLFSQLWGFAQIQTRFVLQCDVDVLIGRKDHQHDYLFDMLNEIIKPNVLSVGFNIPKQQDGFIEYHAPKEGFVPEVRFGLLDLKKIDKNLPIKNPIIAEQFTLTWHRALAEFQKNSQYVSVRGGDSRSYYIHPLNPDKQRLINATAVHGNKFQQVRNIVEQGIYPSKQSEHFDLVANAPWQHPARGEAIIFLLKGKSTPPEKLRRCIDSLNAQNSQNFGVIYIDDASDLIYQTEINNSMTSLTAPKTIVKHANNVGHLFNFNYAISSLCNNPESLIVILDQDDALMRKDVTELLLDALKQGHDLIHLPMFRPNKPLKTYQPCYDNIREKRGNNVWAHMRCFKKKLFDQIPQSELMLNNHWIEQTTDYATMMPLVELAQSPKFIDTTYCYLHERKEYSADKKLKQQNILEHLFLRNTLTPSNVGVKQR